MIVSTNVLAYPKDKELVDFVANGLSYHYKQVQELTQANLVVEVITCTEEAKFAYISPEDFQDEATRLFLSSEIVNFLQELKILDLPETKVELQPMSEEDLTETIPE